MIFKVEQTFLKKKFLSRRAHIAGIFKYNGENSGSIFEYNNNKVYYIYLEMDR